MIARRDVILFVGMLAGLLVTLTAAPPIGTRGEAREGLVVQSMVGGGGFVVPRREGVIASKPPLFHWLAAATTGLVGPSDLALRMPSALAAWGMLLATFVIGVGLFDRRRAWCAVGALASTVGFWRSAFEARVDMVFACCITIALAAFLQWRRDRAPAARAVLYLATVAAVLAKGPIGIVLPGLVATCIAWRDGDLVSLRELGHRPTMVAAFGVVVGWYVIASLSAGRDFLVTQLVHENFERAIGLSSFARQRTSHPEKMLEAFVVQLAPWSLVAAAVLLGGERGTRGPLHAWWVAIVVLFTCAAGKRGVYLLPAYPPVALIAGDVLGRAGTRLVAAGLAFMTVVVCAGTLLVSWRDPHRHRLEAFATAIDEQLDRTVAVGTRGVSEGDRLVLAYRLHRPLPHVGRSGPLPPILIVPPSIEQRGIPGCRPREDGEAHGEPFVVLDCTPSSDASS